jgi:protein Tex
MERFEYTMNIKLIADELKIKSQQVVAVLKLFDDGGTVPFIARYRKEITGSLDETVILEIKNRNEQLKELDCRKKSILKSLIERELLTFDLEQKVNTAKSLMLLEDIYLPYRLKRRTRAVIAREKGLEPLAKAIFKQINDLSPEKESQKYINKNNGIFSVDDALDGAKDIMAEWIAENTEARKRIRNLFNEKGVIYSKVLKDKKDDGIKFKDYFDWNENINRIPGHRVLAMFRGSNEGVLSVKIRPPEEDAIYSLKKFFLKNSSGSSEIVVYALIDSYKRLLMPSIENEITKDIKDTADTEAIEIFSSNLRELLMQAPLGRKNIMALDPGFRTGVKLVCLNSSGDLLHNETIFPVASSEAKAVEAGGIIKSLCSKYGIEAIAIGNGTAGRETEAFVRSLKLPDNILIVMVNESGASIYSASKTAREEFPNHDITVRGAVSIGRRLMDPLAELVKIDPKSIGVGQYQHDVDQAKLKEALNVMVESCVNAVGVDLNTASSELLTFVSGVGPVLAKNIIDYRTKNGPFKSKSELKKVKRLGANAFQQAAGFFRINGAKNPLDQSAVHPESYFVVSKMAKNSNCDLVELINSEDLQNSILLNDYVTDKIGLPTLKDIVSELSKPGRDPREKFELFSFLEGINSIEDLTKGMKLPGIVTNVTKFGAFVDVGVHQDGLVHISELADCFVKDPSEIVKVQQKVTVTVMDVDARQKRISLSMR